jgi:hypothetical protein
VQSLRTVQHSRRTKEESLTEEQKAEITRAAKRCVQGGVIFAILAVGLGVFAFPLALTLVFVAKLIGPFTHTKK